MTGRPTRKLVISIVCALVLQGCGHYFHLAGWRVGYLQDALKKNAVQDDVVKRLGPAHSSQTLSNGQDVWAYRYMERGYSVGNSCYEYILTFDKEKVLRNWKGLDC